MAGQTILEFLPEINLKEVLSVMEKQRTFWQEPEKKGAVCTPVFDKEGVLHFCFWEFGSDRLSGISSRAAKMMKAAKAAKADRAAGGTGSHRTSPLKALAERWAAGAENRKKRGREAAVPPAVSAAAPESLPDEEPQGAVREEASRDGADTPPDKLS
jgi:hypothetical protein